MSQSNYVTIDMATSSGVLCAVCDAQQITKCADVWCPECEEGLCTDCQKHHSISRATRTHSTIPVDQYQKLPASISNIVNYCQEHGTKYTNYCPHHEELCCPGCISTTHITCTGFLSVQEITKTSKTSTMLDSMKRSLNDIDKNIEKVIQNSDQNLSEIRQQRKVCIDKIKEIRARITSHLDTLEQKFIKDVNAVEQNIQSKLASLVDRLSTEKKIVYDLKNNITAIKEHASDLQTFFGITTYKLERKVEKSEKYIESLSEDGSLNQLSLKCNINDTIWDKLSQITSFGSVSIETDHPTRVLNTEKEKQAQIIGIIHQPSPKSINDIKLSLRHTYKTPKPGSNGYKGCIIDPKGKLILADHSWSKVIILNNDDIVRIRCSSYVYGVTTIDDRTFAVSTENGIDIINIDSEEKEKVIKTSYPCYGITHHKGILLWCEENRGIQRMDLSGGNITTLVKQDQLPDECYITSLRDKIYQTNYYTKTVTCYTIKGDHQWEYKNEAVLDNPTSITVDSNSYIYVTSVKSNSVVVLTPDGKNGRQVLNRLDKLDDPWGISFERTKNNLLIINKRGPAFLYHIS